VDLSQLRNPGLELDLYRCGSDIMLSSDVACDRIVFCSQAFKKPNLLQSFPKIPGLIFRPEGGRVAENIDILSSAIHGVSREKDATLTSLFLRHLYLSLSWLDPIRFGAFPELLSLSIDNIECDLHGGNFPLLERLEISGSRLKMTIAGDFPKLRSFIVVGATMQESYFGITAPRLREMTFDTVWNAHRAVISRAKFPGLQLVILNLVDLVLRGHGRTDDDICRSMSAWVPSFKSDERPSALGRVVLKMGRNTPLPVMKKLTIDLPDWIVIYG